MHFREFFTFVFYFVPCVKSQNVNISQLLARSKFKVSCQPLLWMGIHTQLYVAFFLISFDESCNYQWGSWKKNLKGLKDKVCGLQWVTSIRIPSSDFFCVYKHQCTEIAQYGLEIIFNNKRMTNAIRKTVPCIYLQWSLFLLHRCKRSIRMSMIGRLLNTQYIQGMWCFLNVFIL